MTDTVHESWAKSLTTERLATDLRRSADNIRYSGSPEQRAALLTEAAYRLMPTDPGAQRVRGHGLTANADGSLFLTLDEHRFLLEREQVTHLLRYLLPLATIEMRGDGTA